jgi:DNA primase
MFDNLAKRTGLSTEVLSEFTEPSEDITAEIKTETHAHTDEPQEDIEPEPIYHYARPPLKAKPLTALSTARRATILLLDQPQLLKHFEKLPSIESLANTQEECRTLSEIVEYLCKRPDASFNNIIGYWGGSKGLDAQQALASLVANEFFGNLKDIENYDPLKELQDCLSTLASQNARQEGKIELAELTKKGLNALNESERRRYLELIKIGTI